MSMMKQSKRCPSSSVRLARVSRGNTRLCARRSLTVFSVRRFSQSILAPSVTRSCSLQSNATTKPPSRIRVILPRMMPSPCNVMVNISPGAPLTGAFTTASWAETLRERQANTCTAPGVCARAAST